MHKSVVSRHRAALLTLLALSSPIPMISAHAQNAPAPAPSTEASSRLILSRYRQLLLQRAPLETPIVKGWLDTLDAQGQWPDIDYADKQPAAWKTSDHLVRLKALSRAQAEPTNPLANDPRLPGAVSRALDHWLAKRYKNANWWHNDIGVPMLMRDVIVLLGDKLQGQQRVGALEVLNQYGRPQPGGGANTIWQAELALEYGALTGDAALIARSSRMISDEIKITKVEGIQSDWSFHAHNARLQQFHYGGAFLVEGARLGWQLSGTPYAIAPEKMEILANYVLNGSQWMTRGIYTVPGTIDRSVSRAGALRSGDMRSALRHLREAVPARAAELDTVLNRQEGRGAPLVGFRAFPRSDFATHHRPGFSFFLKTVSDRTLLTEVGGNNENLKGQRLSTGDHYLLRDGQEYFNLQPLWNWDLLPGVTWARDAGAIERRPFAGSVGDGSSGVTVMDTAFGARGEMMSARKFWASHGDAVVALIGDLRGAGAQPVRTALDQSLLRGPVTFVDEGGTTKTAASGTIQTKARWIHHNGLAYVPLGGLPLTLQLEPVTGSWFDINKTGSPVPITQPVFLPVLEHGTKPNAQSSGYVMLGAPNAAQVANLVAKPTWQVLQNNAKCQAVRWSDGTVMAAFWEAGSLNDGVKPLISVDQPCLILMSQGKIRASDPTQKGGALNVTLGNGTPFSLTLPPGGEAAVR